jgi:mono/diheme cytochrome c family protein
LFDSLSAMAAGKQKRGSNEGRCGIIRGLKPFKNGKFGHAEKMRSCEMGKLLSGVSMKAFGGYGLAAIVLAVGISAAVLWVPANRSITVAQTNSGAGEKGEVERGRYLVEEVAKCPECHTPRDARGELRADAWLRGAPIWIKPVAPISNWADHAPPLAGFPSFTEEQGERILEKGTGPEGEELRPPMHIYHMNHADAKAIIAYLKSLPRGDRSN